MTSVNSFAEAIPSSFGSWTKIRKVLTQIVQPTTVVDLQLMALIHLQCLPVQTPLPNARMAARVEEWGMGKGITLN